MQYPYYILPDVEEYRKLDPRSEKAGKLSRRIAANIGDYATQRLVLGIDPPEFARFYPDMETSTPSTMDTIDSFLDKFGGNLSEDPLGEISGGYILSEEETSMAESGEKEIEERGEDNLGILLKEKRYEEALQLIERQNLINPQKSIYFALQNRFIRKLMAIEKHRKNKTQG